MRDVILIKWGGSLITDKRRPRTLRRHALGRLARELALGLQSTRCDVVLGHGSGSFGHVAAADHDLVGGIRGTRQRRGASLTQQEARRLHLQVLEALTAAGCPTFSVAPAASLLTLGGRPRRGFFDPLRGALERRLVPVTFGDVVIDLERGVFVCSTETILLAVARDLRRHGRRVRRVVWLGDTDGVVDAQGRTVSRISTADWRRIGGLVGPVRGTDVTGGMRLRLETARALSRLGIESWIVNGGVAGLQTLALAGKPVAGTRVLAAGGTSRGLRPAKSGPRRG